MPDRKDLEAAYAKVMEAEKAAVVAGIAKLRALKETITNPLKDVIEAVPAVDTGLGSISATLTSYDTMTADWGRQIDGWINALETQLERFPKD